MPHRVAAGALIGLLIVMPVASADGQAAAAADAGWRPGQWNGIPPAHWVDLPGGGLRVTARDGQGSFMWRPARGSATCLTWRWRVDAGPPAARLDRRGGDDRAIGVFVGFDGWPPRVTLAQRTAHSSALALAGLRRVPRTVLAYVWGGTGEEPQPCMSPYMADLGSVRVLRTAHAPRGEWQVERVNLAADWRASFGGAPPPLIEIAIASDAEDTRARVDARIEDIHFIPCEP